MPVADSWDGARARWKRILAPRVITWIWLAFASLALAYALITQDDLSDAVRMNQCESIESSARERLIILRQSNSKSELATYWRTELIPDLRERWDRGECEGAFPQ